MTDKKDEALKLALEALENAEDQLAKPYSTGARYAITAIREALAPQPAQQQEPEYKGWYCAHCQRGVDASEVTYHEQHTVCGRVITDDVPPKAQPSKPWVGLTQDELNMIGDRMRTWNSHSLVDVYTAIEAKLKEKNA